MSDRSLAEGRIVIGTPRQTYFYFVSIVSNRLLAQIMSSCVDVYAKEETRFSHVANVSASSPSSSRVV